MELNIKDWHLIKEGNMPEDVDREYTLKCSEFTNPVFVITSDGIITSLIRFRTINEDSFKWAVSKLKANVKVEFKGNPVAWAWKPTKKNVKKFLKELKEKQ